MVIHALVVDGNLRVESLPDSSKLVGVARSEDIRVGGYALRKRSSTEIIQLNREGLGRINCSPNRARGCRRVLTLGYEVTIDYHFHLAVDATQALDRKSTRLNSSHQIISYA